MLSAVCKPQFPLLSSTTRTAAFEIFSCLEVSIVFEPNHRHLVGHS